MDVRINVELSARRMITTTSLDWLQTLADGTRVRLLRLLEEHELSVSEMCAVLQLPQSTVSRHLKVLAADQWVSHRRDGTNHLYRVDSADWCEARTGLWSWVRVQADNPTTSQDQQRLRQVLAQRSRSEQFFSSTAEHWDRLRIELFGKQLDAFVLAATLPRDAVVGELGCGSAPICRLVAPYVAEAIAIDSSEAMLAAARHRLGQMGHVGKRRPVRLVHAELTETGLPDGVLDAAWLVLVLPYIDEPISVLTEAARILKADMPLVIVDLLPHERATYRQEMGHVRLGLQRAELEVWLKAAGLQLDIYQTLPPDPDAKGPALFAAVATKPE